MSWHYGDIYEQVARVVDPTLPAFIHVEPPDPGSVIRSSTLSWGDLRAFSNRLARAFLNVGLHAGDKVAHYLRNEPAYCISFVACCKARLAHVNVNYRYKSEELLYLLDNADCAVVVYAAEFADQVATLRSRAPLVKLWLEVGPAPLRNEFAQSYVDAIGSGDDQDLELERSPEDIHMIYTGGTTGMPKGVMWRHQDLWFALGGGGNNALGIPPVRSLDSHIRNVAEKVLRPRQLPCNPLMHGAGLMMAISSLTQGGCVVTVGGTRFNAAAVLASISQHRVTGVSMVGDAFGRPLLDELDQNPGRYDLSSLQIIVSTGAMWSAAVKEGLLKHQPKMFLFDTLGSSESIGFANSSSTGSVVEETASFKLGNGCKVFDEHLCEVRPGSGVPGFLARSGAIPLGYYKDAERSAKTFPTIDGIRYAMPGDYCLLAADGSITLLGRSSGVINTGGEKVFAEEIEEILKLHESVQDALVFGWPSVRWGQVVVAVVQLDNGGKSLENAADIVEQTLRTHVRKHLADYKSPRRILTMQIIPRAANGKPDYGLAKQHAATSLQDAML